MFKSLIGIVSDVVDVVSAPVEIAVDVTRAATELARKVIPKGEVVLIATVDKQNNRGHHQIAWRHPSKPELVPDGWEWKEVTL